MSAQPSGDSVSLGTHSARGLVYLFCGQMATKVVGFITQILLLYLLDKSDFGLVTLAGTITTFILLIGQSGVVDVLVHRRAFHRWAVPGFWLALALGLLSALLIGISAPIFTSFYGGDQSVRDQLFWLLIASMPMPLPYALSVVPKAQLSRQLRFRALSVVNSAEVFLQSFFTLIFAWFGFGPYSLVVANWVGGFVLAAALWWWVRPSVEMRLRLRRWRYLIGDSAQLLASDFGWVLVHQSDYIMLGLFRTDVTLVGVYTVGFRMSLQTVRLLAVNLMTILFPAFTRLNDQPQRQYEAFFKAQRILAMVGVSGCLLQAATADPFARLFFPTEWYPSIIVMQVLSLGMATRMIGGGSYSLLKSHGRFAVVRNCFWGFALTQVMALALVLWAGGGIVGVSIVVSICAAFAGPIMFYVAIRPFGGGWAEVGSVLARPLVCGVLSVGSAWLIARSMESSFHGRWLYLLQLAEICVVSVILNGVLARLWMRPVWDDLWLRLRRMLPRRAAA
jgi:PST family polysaccharide transporter